MVQQIAEVAELDAEIASIDKEIREHSQAIGTLRTQLLKHRVEYGYCRVAASVRRVVARTIVWRPGAVLISATACGGIGAIMSAHMIPGVLTGGVVGAVVSFLLLWLPAPADDVPVLSVRMNQIRSSVALVRSQIGTHARQVRVHKVHRRDLQKRRDDLRDALVPVGVKLKGTRYVRVGECVVFGHGMEWVYAYTFPAHEDLAMARGEGRFPIKIGMSTQINVVERIQQQVAGTSTAISEPANLKVAFRVDNSRGMERWIHNRLSSQGCRIDGSIGREWFRTNASELIEMYRAYQRTVNRRRS